MKEKEINFPSLLRLKISSTLLFFSTEILQENELAADSNSLEHPFQPPMVNHEWNLVPRKLYLFHFGAPPQGRAIKNWSIDSYNCFPPRKSLVKGERFVRYEGKPELTNNGIWNRYDEDDLLTQVGFIFILNARAQQIQDIWEPWSSKKHRLAVSCNR